MIAILLQKILDLLNEKLSSIGSFISSFAITDPQDGQTLVYDNETEKWVNTDPANNLTQTKTGALVNFNTSISLPLVDIETSESATKIVHMNGTESNATFFQGLFLGTYAFIDLGSLTWASGVGGAARFVANIVSALPKGSGNVLSYDFDTSTNTAIYAGTVDNAIAIHTTGSLWVRDTDYATPEDFKTAMNGHYIIYELATATTPTITNEQFNTLCSAFSLNGSVYSLPLASNFNTFVGVNNVFTDNGDITIEYYNGSAKDVWDISNHTKDLTANLTIDFQTIEQSSCNVKAYQEGHIVVLELNYMKYLTTPTEIAVMITGLPKPKDNIYSFVYDIYNAQVGGRMRVNTNGELTQWYFRPYPNHDICGQIVYITDEV